MNLIKQRLAGAIGIAMIFISLSCSQLLYAQVHDHFIDVSKVEKLQLKQLPKLGGTNPTGEEIAVNNHYISKSGIPIIPITGEMHFSRYPNKYWDESIKKMKAGGINMLATYVFWNIHEEKEGKFDWRGDKDLRKFLELCAQNKILAVVRIGPFCHGEIRNGGLPDWLLGKPVTVRANDSLYLHYVALLYNEIGKQLKGLYYKDGGPIVGVQIENEYQHSASPWGLTYPDQPYDMTVADRDRTTAQEGVGIASENNANADEGNEHMRILKNLAIKAGIVVPLYTVTGWGYAATIPNETLPVTAAYAYPTWTAKREFSPFYLYKDLHQSPDYAPVRYDPEDYPAFAAELGSGIMTTYSRRPIVPAESMDALINRCLGGGANGIGYYMFHGGSTPTGEHYFFNDEAYGYPKISYDFQAPIGEYGQVRPSFQRLKLIHYFVNDFAAQLAPMVTVLPGGADNIKPDNLNDLRYAVRTNGQSGFVFLNNFQDNAKNHDQQNIRIKVKTTEGNINTPETGSFNLKAEENLILPFNLDINGSKLIYSTAQLLTKGQNDHNAFYVFFNLPGIDPEFCFAQTQVVSVGNNSKVFKRNGLIFVKCLSGSPAEFTLTAADATKTHVLVISKDMALTAYQQDLDSNRRLIFTQALALADGQDISLYSVGKPSYTVSIYPEVKDLPAIDHGSLTPVTGNALFSNFNIQLTPYTALPQLIKTGTRKLAIIVPSSLPDGVDDVFLNIDYIGDTAQGFLNGELVADEFYKGIPWEIGLKRFIGKSVDNQFGFYFRPLMKNASYMVDLPKDVADMANKSPQTLKINNVTFTPEYRSVINLK